MSCWGESCIYSPLGYMLLIIGVDWAKTLVAFFSPAVYQPEVMGDSVLTERMNAPQ